MMQLIQGPIVKILHFTLTWVCLKFTFLVCVFLSSVGFQKIGP